MFDTTFVVSQIGEYLADYNNYSMDSSVSRDLVEEQSPLVGLSTLSLMTTIRNEKMLSKPEGLACDYEHKIDSTSITQNCRRTWLES